MKKILFIISISISLFVNGQMSGSLAADDYNAALFISTVSISNPTQKDALILLSKGMKVYGIFQITYAAWPFVGGTGTTNSYNLINTSTYQLTFNGGWTHSSTGSKPDGTSGYADPNFIPSAVLNSTDLVAFGYCSRTNSAVALEYVMGGYDGINGVSIALYIRRNTDAAQVISDFATGTSYRYADYTTSTDGTGFFVGSQQGSDLKIYRNGSVVGSNTGATLGLGLSTVTVYIGTANYIGSPDGAFTDKETDFNFISKKLTDGQVASFNTIVQAFNTRLSR